MKIAIVDDEEKWRKLLYLQVLKNINKTAIIHQYSSGDMFIASSEYYDIVLIDIKMPGENGLKTISLYKQKYKETIIIIVTVRIDLARKGYLVGAFRYIDKSNVENEIREAFDKIKEIFNNRYLFLLGETENALKKVLIRDIFYIETDGRKTKIHTCECVYINHSKISELEILLENYGFFRCHKSYLANLNNAESIDKEFIYFKNEKKAYVSVRKYSETKKRYLQIPKNIDNYI